MRTTHRSTSRIAIGTAALATAILMTLTTSLPASANSPTVTVPLVEKSADASRATLIQLQNSSEGWEPVDAERIRKLTSVALTGSVAVMDGLALDPARATAWLVDGTTTLLRIPAATGQGVTSQSSVSVMFDPKEHLAGYTQMVFTPVDEKSGRVQSWVNGISSLDQVVTAQNDPEPTAAELMSRAYKKGDWWGNFNQCLSNAGIAAWVITGISIACAAICVATAGLGCVACLGAASAGFSGTVSFCITTANLNS